MRNLLSLVSTLILLLSGLCGATEVVNQVVISGLHSYADASPIVAPDGKYHGVVASDVVNDNVDVYDLSGQLTQSFHFECNVRKAIARQSDNSDTLIIYVLQDTSYVWYQFDLFRLSMVTIVCGDVTIQTVHPIVPVRIYSQTVEPDYLQGDLRFDYSRQYEIVGVICPLVIGTTYWELTMGTYWERYCWYYDYSLDLSHTLIDREADKCATGYFLGDDSCGVIWESKYYYSVIDDPWNSYTDHGTTVAVMNCDTLIKARYTKFGGTTFFIAGNFIPSTATDELIYAGSGMDLTGPIDTAAPHWICYSFAGDTLTREWEVPIPSSFGFHVYLPHRNVLVGTDNHGGVRLMDAESLVYTDVFQVAHSFVNKTFLLAPGMDLPEYFGRFGDTVFVYDFNLSTDVDGPGESILSEEFTLYQNYPNPFNPTTRIRFDLPKASDVQLEIFDILGRRVTTLVNGRMSAGVHTAVWNGTDAEGRPASSGIYLYRLRAGSYSSARKLVLLK